MIRLNCTHCKTSLEMDDAFAGGVCRCQHCGTIQTVPAHLKGSVQPAAGDAETIHGATVSAVEAEETTQAVAEASPPPPAPPPPALPMRTEEGLQELGAIVASSGLAGSGLKTKRLKQKEAIKPVAKTADTAPPVAKEAAVEKGRPYLMFILGGVIAVIIAMLLWLFVIRGSGGGSDAGVVGQAGITAGGGPGFLGTPISEPTIIYLLDRGNASKDTFSYLKEATYRSVRSLGSKRKFEILFWDNGGLQTAFPADSVTPASTDNVAAAQQALEDVFAFGDTDVKNALERAVARNPAAIVMVTAKGWQLDESFVQTVEQARGSSTAKIYTFSIGTSGDSTALKKVAEKTGGTYTEVSESDLQKFAR